MVLVVMPRMHMMSRRMFQLAIQAQPKVLIYRLSKDCFVQLAQKESQLVVADQQHFKFQQQINALHAEVQRLHSQLDTTREQELAAAVAADLNHILDDPDQLPAEADQLMSSLKTDAPESERELPAKLRQLQKQLRKKEEEMKERDLAMQQLLKGADRIEELQRVTLAQLAHAQSEVCVVLCPCWC